VLGTIVARGDVRVGNRTAPSGTTVFDGDRILALNNSTALVQLAGGGRIEVVNGIADLHREGNRLLVKAERGLLRFRFEVDSRVRFRAGRYDFTSSSSHSAHAGDLGLNLNGQVAMVLTSGSFMATRILDGATLQVVPDAPMVVLDQFGRGSVAQNGRNLTDRSKSWQTNELKGKCVSAGGERYRILDNTRNDLTIEGTWKLATGVYDYTIADCPEPAPGVPTTGRASKSRSRAIWIGAGAAAAALIGIAGASAGGGGSGAPPVTPGRSPS
jgi:hypothetical protein